MAKALRKPISIKDVIEVYHLYNKAWHQHVKFDEENGHRLSDYELWREGKPSIQLSGTIGDGYAELKFVFRNFGSENTTENKAQDYVINFIKQHNLPYTFFEVSPSRSILGLVTYEPGEKVPKYVRVNVRFEDDDAYRKRTGLKEATYHNPYSVDNVALMYHDKLLPYILMEPDTGAVNTKLELEGIPVRINPVRKRELQDPYSKEKTPYVMVSFVFFAYNLDPKKAQNLVVDFMTSLKLPVTITDWELGEAQYDQNRAHAYKPVIVFAIYNPHNRYKP